MFVDLRVRMEGSREFFTKGRVRVNDGLVVHLVRGTVRDFYRMRKRFD